MRDNDLVRLDPYRESSVSTERIETLRALRSELVKKLEEGKAVFAERLRAARGPSGPHLEDETLRAIAPLGLAACGVALGAVVSDNAWLFVLVIAFVAVIAFLIIRDLRGQMALARLVDPLLVYPDDRALPANLRAERKWLVRDQEELHRIEREIADLEEASNESAEEGELRDRTK